MSLIKICVILLNGGIMNLSGYGALLVFLICSIALAVAMLVTSLIVQPRKRTNLKTQTYECGNNPENDAKIKFSSKYYMFAIIFLLFDIETVFLLPWAMLLKKIGLLALFEGIVFLFILILGYIYLFKKGAFVWSYENNN